MAKSQAFLVPCVEDGYGKVQPLFPHLRYKLGRAPTNQIVVPDDLSSREHAELYFADGQWRMQDLGSLNGTRLNSVSVRGEEVLAPNDEIRIGNAKYLFLENVADLPPLAPLALPAEQFEIRNRLRITKYLDPQHRKQASTGERTDDDRRKPQFVLEVLYRLGFDMSRAESLDDLLNIVLDGLMEAVPAKSGAILEVSEAKETTLKVHRYPDSAAATYNKTSEFLTKEVLSNRETMLAENVARNPHLRNRESLAELRVGSLICSPIHFEDRILGLIHLYSLIDDAPLRNEDADFTDAVAHQTGLAWCRLQRQTELSANNRVLSESLRIESELVGDSESLRKIQSQIGRVADTNVTVLIRGESGTGKELVARALHQGSSRREGPFVTLNCAAIAESLLESELFGHEKGSFTGATERMIGKFESANMGTIFLDEIGEMPLSIQAKFLRVLEGHPFERVGGNTAIRTNVRVVAATNRALEEAVRASQFRRDLFFRLQVVEIQVSPLRDRHDDIPLLCDYFLRRFCREIGRRLSGFTPEAMRKLQTYSWPGNVRELRNAIERAVVLSSGTILDVSDLWLSHLEEPPTTNDGAYAPRSLEEIEKVHILATLKHVDWNKSQTASILGIERSTLDRKIKAFELRKE